MYVKRFLFWLNKGHIYIERFNLLGVTGSKRHNTPLRSPAGPTVTPVHSVIDHSQLRPNLETITSLSATPVYPKESSFTQTDFTSDFALAKETFTTHIHFNPIFLCTVF